MSMPGFRYYIHCSACAQMSDDYPAYVFPHLHGFNDIHLPCWSVELKCYGRVICDLSSEVRQRLEKDHEARAALAIRLSSPAMTVGSPRLGASEKSFTVTITPQPHCPFCGAEAEVHFGSPPRS
jgi:hypothetical protein